MYFTKVKEKDEIFGLVFGHGVVTTVWDNDSFYTFEVTYDNGQVVPYTEEGYPAWGNLSMQTAFYKKDIDVVNLDFSPTEEVLSVKRIIKLRAKNKLEIKCPSGIWHKLTDCPGYVAEQYLTEGKLHLFRKAKK